MKRYPLILEVLVWSLLLSGCNIPLGDELLAPPKASKMYQSLQLELEKVLSTQSYAAPLSGDNRSTVQLVDLDNDGYDEAVAFFKTNGNSNEYTVYIYKKYQDTYVCTGSIMGMGTGIQSVDYPVITPNGQRGIVIAWQIAGDGQSMVTMCDFNERTMPRVLLQNEFTAMELVDLTGNGAKDLLLLAKDSTGKRTARLFQYREGQLLLAGEAAVSPDTVTVERMSSGHVAGNLPAVFAEEKTASGVGLSTDIFVYTDGILRNLALNGEDSTTQGTYRPVSIDATDINHDGIIELPRAMLMAGYTDASAADTIYMLDWYTYSVHYPPQRVYTTYHNVSEGWYFHIDDEWHDWITATKSSENGLSTVRFYELLPDSNKQPLFSISCAVGSLREYYAGREDLIQLSESDKAVFFARLEKNIEPAEPHQFQLDAEGIRQRFSLVTTVWND